MLDFKCVQGGWWEANSSRETEDNGPLVYRIKVSEDGLFHLADTDRALIPDKWIDLGLGEREKIESPTFRTFDGARGYCEGTEIGLTYKVNDWQKDCLESAKFNLIGR
jgi:hypothetical protein